VGIGGSSRTQLIGKPLCALKESEVDSGFAFGGAIVAKVCIFHSDPEIMGGTPVFVGTRVPMQALLDYLEGGHTIGEFLDDFPSVKREQVIAVLEEAKHLLVSGAPAAR
jgi:uncharacterized protein (DUF433 family)